MTCQESVYLFLRLHHWNQLYEGKRKRKAVSPFYRSCYHLVFFRYTVMYILSQWAWFSMSTRHFIFFGQSSAHPLLDDRWIARSAIRRDSWELSRVNQRTYTASGVPRFVRKCNLRCVTNATRWFWLFRLKTFIFKRV